MSGPLCPSLHAGSDPGNNGGIVIMHASGEIHAAYPMPTLRNGAGGKPLISAPLIAELFSGVVIVSLAIEHVSVRPGEGAVGAKSFGRGLGILEGVAAALAIPVTFYTPPTWRRAVGLPAGQANTKDAARAECVRRWPSKAGLFALKKSDGIADASLICLASLLLNGGLR